MTTWIDAARAAVSECKFQDYLFEVREGHGGVFVQGIYLDADIITGAQELQHTRKWLLSPAMTKSEIVQTVFKLCLTSMEHRTREGFTYREARVFGPHFDVDDLHRVCLDRRGLAGARDEH